MAKQNKIDEEATREDIAKAAAFASGRISRATMFANVVPEQEEENVQVEPEPELSDEQKRPALQKAATYRIGSDVIERINALCEKSALQKSNFVRALLIYSLDQLESGTWELPPRQIVKGKLDV